MCKVMKKGIVGAGLGALALAALFGTHAPSYVKTAFRNVRSHVKAGVPVEFDIDRARQEIADLTPAIHKNLEALAKAEVEVEHLQREIVAHRGNLDRQQRELMALRDQMGPDGYRRTDGSSRAQQLQLAASRRLDSFKHSKQILAEKEATLDLRQQQVAAAKQTLETIIEQKKLLEAKIEQIETRHKQIQATSAANEFNFVDESALARAKQTVTELEKKLDEMAKVAEYEGQLVDKDLPVLTEPTRDVAHEIDEELNRVPAAPGDKPL